MKTKAVVTIAGMILLLAPAQSWASPQQKQTIKPATNWHQISIPKLPAFSPKLPKRVVLHNGMVVFLTEDHELPLISGSAMIRGGAVSEPANKAGLVDLYGATWRTGGTDKLTGDQLDDFLEARAAKVETSGGGEHTSIAFDCLKGDFPQVFDVFANLLRHPAFREDKVSLEKKQLYSAISRRNDETRGISQIQARMLGYGKQSPYARIPEYATVAAVTRGDLLDWHNKHVVPNNMILGIVGDFDAKQMEATLNRVFGNWPKGEVTPPPAAEIQPEKPGIYLVNKSDVKQSEIRMISLGIERRNPDYYALQVMNVVLGGGFSSRLFSNLRTKEGLAYAVGGGVGSSWDHPGLTTLMIGTKTRSTVRAIRGMWEQVDEMKTQPPTNEEIKRAKDSILNSFIFRLDTPAKVMHEQQAYEFYNYPSDFLQRYRKGVEKVTSADVVRVAKEYLRRDKFKVLVVGNAPKFEKQLAGLGAVTPVDITIPSPNAQPTAAAANHTKELALAAAPASPEATAGGSTEDARAVMSKLADAVGGAAKIASVKSLHEKIEATSERGVPVEIEQYSIYPDRQAQKITLLVGVLTQVVTPEEAFMVRGAELRELTPLQKSEGINLVKGSLLNVLLHLDDPKYTFHVAGKDKVGETEATMVDVNADGFPMRWWIGPDGLLLKQQYTAKSEFSQEEISMVYSGWKEFDGLRYPTEEDSYVGGMQMTRTEIQSLEVNPEIDMTMFEKPQQ